ncbi:MAG: hypothetical protein ACK52I_19055 [Pseudomonadota bacterium]
MRSTGRRVPSTRDAAVACGTPAELRGGRWGAVVAAPRARCAAAA